MREILFRGKRKDNNEWIYGGVVHQTDFYGLECDKWFIIDGTDTHDYDIGYEYEVIPKTVSEWTGLYDKNNVRIFEGDIIKSDTYLFYVEFGICGGTKNVDTDVGYNGFHFVPADKHTKEHSLYGLRDDIIFFLNQSNIFEVIGNIYDNPELLKEEN